MVFVVFPAERLCDAEAAPLLLEQDSESAGLGVEVVSRDGLEHVFGEHDVAVLKVVVGVPGGVVDHLLKLEDTRLFRRSQQPRLLLLLLLVVLLLL